MSDYYHGPEGPEDPFRRDDAYDPNVRGGSSAWGWIAAAVFLLAVLAVAFGIGHQAGQPGTNTASNDANPPVTRMAPPEPSTVPPTATPAPANPAPAAAPAPAAPTQQH